MQQGINDGLEHNFIISLPILMCEVLTQFLMQNFYKTHPKACLHDASFLAQLLRIRSLMTFGTSCSTLHARLCLHVARRQSK